MVRAAEPFLGALAQSAEWLEGGDEALVLRVVTDLGAVVLHASPPWRTRKELEWVHAVVRHAHTRVPEVVTPFERFGRTAFEWQGRLVAAFPFVAGEPFDRDDAVLRADAARLLALIHTALLDCPAGPRPESRALNPVPPADLADLNDPALDAWWLAIRGQGFIVAPTHGDYYRRNLLCENRRIVGVIDWHDSSIRPAALELAGATFELCRNDEHVLQFDRADTFIELYRAAGGPVANREVEFLLPLIRLWIRNDVRSSLAHGGDVSDNYVAKQMRAFRELASCEWRPRSDPRASAG
ncbi:MAG TPA: phosphotransferase [Vicinamibacterales bacterium]|nr:phosphotransferase [Vicinamibacterales bacterium]